MKKEDLQGYVTILILIFFLAIAGAIEAPSSDPPSPSQQKVVIDSHGEPQLVANR